MNPRAIILAAIVASLSGCKEDANQPDNSIKLKTSTEILPEMNCDTDQNVSLIMEMERDFLKVAMNRSAERAMSLRAAGENPKKLGIYPAMDWPKIGMKGTPRQLEILDDHTRVCEIAFAVRDEEGRLAYAKYLIKTAGDEGHYFEFDSESADSVSDMANAYVKSRNEAKAAQRKIEREAYLRKHGY